MTRVAINGFGRIGRLVARAILERPECGLELVAINDLAEPAANARLFKHGAGDLVIDGRRIRVTAEKDRNILRHSEDPLVSSSIVHTSASSTVDSEESAIMDRTAVRVASWYDNEWGFSNRVVGTARTMVRQG